MNARRARRAHAAGRDVRGDSAHLQESRRRRARSPQKTHTRARHGKSCVPARIPLRMDRARARRFATTRGRPRDEPRGNAGRVIQLRTRVRPRNLGIAIRKFDIDIRDAGSRFKKSKSTPATQDRDSKNRHRHPRRRIAIQEIDIDSLRRRLAIRKFRIVIQKFTTLPSAAPVGAETAGSKCTKAPNAFARGASCSRARARGRLFSRDQKSPWP